MRPPKDAQRETVGGLAAGIARSDALRAEGYHVEERLARVSYNRVVRLTYWRCQPA